MDGNRDSGTISFEQPLTKPIRLFLRFEQLVQRFCSGAQGHQSTDAHTALLALLDLYQHGMHVDLKAEVMREIERSLAVLNKSDLEIDIETAKRLKIQLKEGIETTNQIHGQLGSLLKNHHFFNLIRQRITMGGGVNSFDLPIYHLWTSKGFKERQALLEEWAAPYLQLNEVISSLLYVIRAQCIANEFCAEQGFFQQAIPINENWKLLQIVLPADSVYYPEVSSGPQRFSIRFFEPADLSKRPGQTSANVKFTMMHCGV